jgi:hypothetical protein
MVRGMAGLLDSKTLVGSGGAAVQQTQQQPESYRVAKQARARAAFMRDPISPRVERALARLDKTLESNQQPDAEAPRGYYINIEI